MKSYLVRWEIDIDADSPEEAARKALSIQRDPDSLATVFDVFVPGAKRPETIDIDDYGMTNPVTVERERIIKILSETEFTSLDHMPHEAASIIRGA